MRINGLEDRKEKGALLEKYTPIICTAVYVEQKIMHIMIMSGIQSSDTYISSCCDES